MSPFRILIPAVVLGLACQTQAGGLFIQEFETPSAFYVGSTCEVDDAA